MLDGRHGVPCVGSRCSPWTLGNARRLRSPPSRRCLGRRIECRQGFALDERGSGVAAAAANERTIYFGEVVLPKSAGLGVAAQIVGGELDVADGKLFACRVQSGLEESDSVVLEHVQQCGLAGIVESQEEELGVLVRCREDSDSAEKQVAHVDSTN